jgi:hypothetical protein
MPKIKKKGTAKSKVVSTKKKISIKRLDKKSGTKQLSPILRAFFVGLLIVLLAVLIPSLYPNVELFLTKKMLMDKTGSSYSTNIFNDLNSKTVDSITIKTVQDTFTIERTTRHWVIDGREVDSKRINTLFSSLNTFNLGTLLSKNPKNHLELGISDLLGSFVTIRSGSKEVKFVIGNPSSVLNSFYFRFLGSNEVYLSTGDLRSVITLTKEEWLAK